MTRLVELVRKLFRQDARSAAALTDPVTALPTRVAILAELKKTLRRSRHRASVAVAIVEFSDISSVHMGDERALMRQLAALLRAWVPPAHVVGHLREREFAVIFRGVAMVEIQNLASDIVEKVRRESSLEGRQKQLVTIIGLGCSSRGEGDASQLLTLADIALHYASSTGRGWHAIVDSAFVPGGKSARVA